MPLIAAILSALAFLLWILAGIAVSSAFRLPLTLCLLLAGFVGMASAASIMAKWRHV